MLGHKNVKMSGDEKLRKILSTMLPRSPSSPPSLVTTILEKKTSFWSSPNLWSPPFYSRWNFISHCKLFLLIVFLLCLVLITLKLLVPVLLLSWFGAKFDPVAFSIQLSIGCLLLSWSLSLILDPDQVAGSLLTGLLLLLRPPKACFTLPLRKHLSFPSLVDREGKE